MLAFSEVTPDWDALAVDAPPFVRSGWVGPWADAFGAGRDRLQVVTVRDDGRLTAALPVLRRRGLRAPTNWHTPAFGATARDADARRTVWERLYAARAHTVQAGFLDDDELALAVATARAAGRSLV